MNWQPIETAPRERFLLGWVDGCVRLIRWGKTSHVPMYGWNLADQGPENFDLCEPTHWMPLPPAPDAQPAQEPVVTPPCKGMNCGCTNGVDHSLECHAEHAAAIAGGQFVKAPQPAQEPETRGDERRHFICPDCVKSKPDYTALLEQALEALEELRQEYVSTVDGEWGEGVGAAWLPKTSDPVIAAIKEALK